MLLPGLWRDLELVKPTWLLFCLSLIQGFLLFIMLGLFRASLTTSSYIFLHYSYCRHPCCTPKHSHSQACAYCHAYRKRDVLLKQWRDISTTGRNCHHASNIQANGRWWSTFALDEKSKLQTFNTFYFHFIQCMIVRFCMKLSTVNGCPSSFWYLLSLKQLYDIVVLLGRLWGLSGLPTSSLPGSLSASLRDRSRVCQCQWRPPWQQITLTSFLLLLLIAPRPGTAQTPWVGRDWGACVP